LEWGLGDSLGISNRGTKAKIITSCDNAFVTNIVLARDLGASYASEAVHRTPPGSFALCESEAAATTNVLTVRKRSGSNKAPSRNGNRPRTIVMILIFYKNRQYFFNYFIDHVKIHIIKGMKTISFALLGETNVHPRKIFLVKCMYLRYNLH